MVEKQNRLNLKKILEYYDGLKQRPQLYFQPVTPEAFFSHVMSLTRGIELSIDTLSSNDFVSARQHANQIQGWQNHAFSPYVEMREKGCNDRDILLELINIEIKMWQILDQWEKENLSKIVETKRL